ncbi:hypothetical protein [Eggerthella sinensis]|uniref:hypothetical protein n=1 Tax=Eggerthella sinensis TaxID=242230 RepID=UPI00248DA7A6|nr:hypothetical protein [Eggerthella sinensis]
MESLLFVARKLSQVSLYVGLHDADEDFLWMDGNLVLLDKFFLVLCKFIRSFTLGAVNGFPRRFKIFASNGVFANAVPQPVDLARFDLFDCAVADYDYASFSPSLCQPMASV